MGSRCHLRAAHLSRGELAAAAAGASSPPLPTIVLAAIAVAIALVTGWLGGELVDRLGVGVDHGAHLDAPSSLGGRKASEPDGG